ncbi:MAG: Gfo/Idh/MocA family oxidoreductase [Deltaproteobacteria bacterium]|nr:Gfo/Idh/MocA family oxidoreductase [Deltaproteobacteria bacterium]
MTTTTTTKPLRIGVLGAARIAPMALIRPARQVAGVVVSAVAARDPARAQAFARKHGVAKVHATYEAMFADDDVDAVYNPLPNSHHKTLTIKALAAGKHVLCEKPLAANADDARAMHEAAVAAGKVLMEAFHWRYHPLAARVLDEIAKLGKLKRVRASFAVPFFSPSDIRFRKDLAGGALMDTGCYAVNIARTFSGVAGTEQLLVVDEVRPLLISSDVDRAFWGRMHTAEGVEVVVECSLMSAKLLSARAQIEGERGSIDVWNPVVPQFFNRLRTKIDGASSSSSIPGKATYVHQLEAFRDAVVDGKPFPSTSLDGIANMATIDALYTKAGMSKREST